ncbi:hypothetical protein WN943_022497 [Citrus x changshan-huyou]
MFTGIFINLYAKIGDFHFTGLITRAVRVRLPSGNCVLHNSAPHNESLTCTESRIKSHSFISQQLSWARPDHTPFYGN